MRNDKGQFVKGHEVPDEWKEASSLANNGVPNPKNKYPRTEKQLENLRTINIGRDPWNKDMGKIEFACEVCGIPVFDKPYRRKRFCSKECSAIYSHIMRGETHGNYKGEHNELQRSWSEYREWHKNVFERDNYICQQCGNGGKIQAHHIHTWSKYLELRFDIDNGITLCEDCHKQVRGYEDEYIDMFITIMN